MIDCSTILLFVFVVFNRPGNESEYHFTIRLTLHINSLTHHRRIIEKDQQLIGAFKNIHGSDHFLGSNQDTTRFRVLKLIFVKCLIQRIPLNHYMRYNLNDLKVLEQ